jgi:hypothetical protein
MKLKSHLKSPRAQAMAEYVLLLCLCGMVLTLLTVAMREGYSTAFNKYKTVIELPYPF